MNNLLFLASTVIGFFVLLILLVFLLRRVIRQKRAKNLLKKWKGWTNTKKTIPLWQHAGVVFFGLCFSTVCYLVVITSVNLHFTNPPTSSINWYTIHNYPRQQDTFYFVTMFTSILLITSFLWFLWIRLKNKK